MGRLANSPPAAFYHPSPRPYPERLDQPWYDPWHAMRTQRRFHQVGGNFVFISESLAGEPVGLAETDTGDWVVRFADIDLGVIDQRTKSPRASEPHGPAAAKLTQTLSPMYPVHSVTYDSGCSHERAAYGWATRSICCSATRHSGLLSVPAQPAVGRRQVVRGTWSWVRRLQKLIKSEGLEVEIAHFENPTALPHITRLRPGCNSGDSARAPWRNPPSLRRFESID